MARTRSIKPGFFHDTRLTELPPLARLLFAGLWCYSDRAGRIEDNPRQIKHDILPDDRCDIPKLLNDLAAGVKPFIFRYEIGGVRYIQIRTWSRHQNPHLKEPASTIPAPESFIPAPDQSGSSPGSSGTSHASSLIPLTGNPEPVTANPVQGPDSQPPPGPVVRKTPEWARDETYTLFVSEYRKCAKPLLDEDFSLAWFNWNQLDFEQKQVATMGVMDRIAWGIWTDPQFIPKPANYLKFEWKRPAVKPTQKSPSSESEQATEIYFNRRKQQESRKPS